MQRCIYPSSSMEKRNYGKLKKPKKRQDWNKQKKKIPLSPYDVADRSLCNLILHLYHWPALSFPHIQASLQTLFS